MPPDSTDKQRKLRPKPQWSWKIWWAWCLVISVLYGSTFFFEDGYDPDALIGACVAGPFTATFYYGGYFLTRRWINRMIQRQFQAEDLSEKAESLQENLDQDFFTNLVRINFKYLDKYYLQTQEQGDKSFLLCAVAAVVGLIIIIAGIALMFFNKTAPAYLTTASGVLSEFIAAVFFYLYNKTVLSMGRYHQKLVITQNIALALKITNDLPSQNRVQSQIALVHALTCDVNHLLSGELRTVSDSQAVASTPVLEKKGAT